MGCILAIAFGIPMYLLTNTGEPFLIVLCSSSASASSTPTLTGTQGAGSPSCSTPSTRTSGASIGYQVAASIAGFAPFLAVLLANSFGWIGPALFSSGRLRRPRRCARHQGDLGPRQRAEVDAVIRGDADPKSVEAAPA